MKKLTNFLIKIRRKINNKTLNEYKSIWNFEKSENPILKLDTDYFDVSILKSNHKLLIYFSNRGKNCIDLGIFSLDDMKLYNKFSVLFGEKNTWSENINRPCVIKLKTEYYMWFTGQIRENSCIGFAKSIDGIFWTIKENPIIIPEESFEKNAVMNPCVIYDNKFGI